MPTEPLWKILSGYGEFGLGVAAVLAALRLVLPVMLPFFRNNTPAPARSNGYGEANSLGRIEALLQSNSALLQTLGADMRQLNLALVTLSAAVQRALEHPHRADRS